MEFVNYEEVRHNLREQGLFETSDADGCLRLEVEADPRFKTLHIKDAGSAVEPYPDAEVFERDKSALGELLRMVLGKLHLSEVLVIPVSTWRDVIDCVAFDLATDEEWIEIDAIAAMHQNTRNPLAITRGDTRVLIDMIKTLLIHADSPRQDLTLTSDVVPVLVEVFHDGAVSVTCDLGMADQLIKAL